MAQQSFCIACKDQSGGSRLWLSAGQDGSGAWICDLAAGDPQPPTPEYWVLTPIVGTDAYYLLNQATSLYAYFDPFPGHLVALRPLDIFDPGFIIKLDNVGNGWVAINNSNKDGVFGTQVEPPVGGSGVIHYPWKGTDNQMWQFADPLAIGA